ncbi:MAG: response regulator [Crocinitomicaceae bacterium]|nr:response regulator [Crocinitomicaceae bacterium]
MDIRYKTILFFVISLFVFIALSFFVVKSVTDLNTKLAKIEKPNQATEHLNNLSILISKANDRIQKSATASDRVKDSIIPQIKVETALFNSKVKDDLDSILLNEVLSIPNQLLTLDSINGEIHKLELKRIKIIDDGISKDISKMVSSLSVDSVFVIRELKTVLNQTSKTESIDKKINKEEDNRNFFQRLFGRKKESEKAVDIEEKSSEANAFDSLNVKKEREIISKIDTTSFQQTEKSDSIFFEMMLLMNVLTNDIKSINNDISTLKEIRFQIQNNMIFSFEKLVNRYNEKLESQYLSNQKQSSKETKDFINKSILYLTGFALIGLIGFYSIYKSMQANRKFQYQLKENERLANELASQRLNFLHMMSHELRTPLTSIIGYVEQMNVKDENVKSVKLASNYLFNLINNVLDVAKLNSKGLDLVEKPFNLRTLIRESEQTLKPLIINKGLEASFKEPSEKALIYADYHRLQQILYNLINNAVKFTEKGSISLNVEVEDVFVKDKINVSFTIKDTGIGISEEDIQRIFDDFTQVGDRANKIAGTGLGLGLVKRLTYLMGGEIDVKSTLGKGTVFRLSFTFYKANEEAVINDDEINRQTDLLKGKKILVLDDDRLIANLYSRILKKYNAEVKLFYDPLKAYEYLQKHLNAYDLLIFDFKMPNLSGYELWDKLGFSAAKNRPPIILSTANVMQSTEDLSDMDVFDDIIRKPIKENVVIAKIAKNLNLTVNYETKPNQTINEGLFDFSELSLYASDSKEELKALIKMMKDENTIELNKLKEALGRSDVGASKMIIHKLSSRFAQIGVEIPEKLKDFEIAKHMEENQFSFNDALELFDFWIKINGQLIKE